MAADAAIFASAPDVIGIVTVANPYRPNGPSVVRTPQNGALGNPCPAVPILITRTFHAKSTPTRPNAPRPKNTPRRCMGVFSNEKTI
jgi:hypothetical protein